MDSPSAFRLAPVFDRFGDAVHFWVWVGGLLVSASVDRRTLHYSFPPIQPDEHPIATYLNYATEINEAVCRHVTEGDAEPMVLREHHLRACRRSGANWRGTNSTPEKRAS